MLTLRRTAIVLAAIASSFTAAVQAAWDLDNERSAVQFLSIKNASVAELHHFKVVSGGISDGGEAQVTIDLDSVETMIPIRNQRMRELLFETVRFPSATLTAPVPADLASLDAGETRDVNFEVSVELHGKTVPYAAAADVTRLADGSLRVTLREPILVKAADFGLAAGVETLRNVAGLDSISTAMPVTATLVFSEE
jgi:polyisoprenoid-binding protein YceI